MKYFDLHCDTVTQLAERSEHLDSNDLHISLDKASEYDVWAQYFAIFIPDEIRGQQAFEYFGKLLGKFQSEIDRFSDRITFCRDKNMAADTLKAGKNAAFLSIEGGAALAGDIENLYRAYDAGVRMMTLTWNGECELGTGAVGVAENGQKGGGLTKFGKQVVREMTKLGMTIDVSHLSDQGFYDVAQETEAPFVASHSNARAVYSHPRNLEDWQIKEIVRRGGLIGLNFYRGFIDGDGSGGLAALLPHAEHMLGLGGERSLAIGADMDGSTLPDGVRGIEDAVKLGEMLSKTYGKTTADAIFFGNAAGFFTGL
jgi:membrane dipeptidase